MTGWQRWLLCGALASLGTAYICSYGFFLMHSVNFIEAKRNRSALKYSEAHPVSVPAKLTFGIEGNDNARLGGGWHRPDPGGTWTCAADAWLELVIANTNSDIVLRLKATAFVTTHHRATTISVDVNGASAGDFERNMSNASMPIDVRISRALMRDGILRIKLHSDFVGSPKRQREGDDDRMLGVLMASAELSPAHATSR